MQVRPALADCQHVGADGGRVGEGVAAFAVVQQIQGFGCALEDRQRHAGIVEGGVYRRGQQGDGQGER